MNRQGASGFPSPANGMFLTNNDILVEDDFDLDMVDVNSDGDMELDVTINNTGTGLPSIDWNPNIQTSITPNTIITPPISPVISRQANLLTSTAEYITPSTRRETRGATRRNNKVIRALANSPYARPNARPSNRSHNTRQSTSTPPNTQPSAPSRNTDINSTTTAPPSYLSEIKSQLQEAINKVTEKGRGYVTITKLRDEKLVADFKILRGGGTHGLPRDPLSDVEFEELFTIMEPVWMNRLFTKEEKSVAFAMERDGSWVARV
ncbi:hypothetical protein HDU76_013089 [Blyttiomyces sp. JEL0837]|nr:hypothetical protein HDU76_013089 [Blyttiomyces sp. JEL0837]